MKVIGWRIATLTLAAFSILFALAPAALGPEEIALPVHHIGHAMLLAAGVATALLATQESIARIGPPNAVWIAPIVIAPMAAMYAMWPSGFTYLDAHPLVHGMDHLGFVSLGFITAYAGQRYVRGVGWVAGILLVLMGLVAAGFFGVAPQTIPDTIIRSHLS